MGQLVSGGLQAAGSIMEGNAAAAQGDTRKAELKREAELAQIAAKQSGTQATIDLDRTIGAIRALRSSRNLNVDSPSGMAIEDQARRVTAQNIQRNNFNTKQSIENMRLAGQSAQNTGNAAQMSGYLKGAGQFISAIDSAIKPGTGTA